MILRPSRGKVGAASLYAAGRLTPGGAFLYIHITKTNYIQLVCMFFCYLCKN